jgi:hypothetical protein
LKTRAATRRANTPGAFARNQKRYDTKALRFYEPPAVASIGGFSGCEN